jgi:peptidoglycan/LPS O-acetylase OafA/YrhL
VNSESPRVGAHVPALDGIRGLAILLVMVRHGTSYAGVHAFDRWFNHLAWSGWVGVDLFFVLSGYLITGILLDSRRGPRFFRNFYARRALRIFPLYYALIALSFLVLPHLVPPTQAAHFARISGEEPYYWLYLQNFCMARAGMPRHPILDVTWSLAIEEQFYLLWPTVVYLCSPRALKRLSVVLIVVALASRVLCSLVLHLPAYSIYVLTPCHMDTLAAGAFLAMRARELGGLVALAPAARRIGPAAGLAALTLMVGERLAGLSKVYEPGWGPITIIVDGTLLTLAFGSLLVLVLTARPEGGLRRFFESRSLGFFGLYAYGLYLFHGSIEVILSTWVYGPANRSPPFRFPMIRGTEFFGQLLFYALTLATVVPVALLSYHLYEKRFLRLKRYFERSA